MSENKFITEIKIVSGKLYWILNKMNLSNSKWFKFSVFIESSKSYIILVWVQASRKSGAAMSPYFRFVLESAQFQQEI